MLGVVAEAEVVEAAHLGVGGGDHHRAFLVEHLPEVAEAGPVGRALDDEPVFLFAHLALGRDRALAQTHALVDLAAQHAVVLGGLRRAAEGGEDRPDVVHRAEVAVDRARPVLGALQHAHQVFLGLHRFLHVLAQPVDVELDARDALERGDHRLLELLDHVFAHVRRDVALALVGHVQHHGLAAVLVADQLEPLHEGEAAGVAEQQDVGPRHRVAGGADLAAHHHAQVGLHVGADVFALAVALGVHDHLAALLAHAVLQRIGLRQAAREVEAHQQLVQVAGHEGGRHLAVVGPRRGELHVVLVDQFLLQPHRVFFLDVLRLLGRAGGAGHGDGLAVHGVLLRRRSTT